MAGEIITTKQQELGSLGFAGLPTIISAAGERASFRFIEFFTANIVTENGAKNQSFEWASALIPPACLPPGHQTPGFLLHSNLHQRLCVTDNVVPEY